MTVSKTRSILKVCLWSKNHCKFLMWISILWVQIEAQALCFRLLWLHLTSQLCKNHQKHLCRIGCGFGFWGPGSATRCGCKCWRSLAARTSLEPNEAARTPSETGKHWETLGKANMPQFIPQQYFTYSTLRNLFLLAEGWGLKVLHRHEGGHALKISIKRPIRIWTP